ncbi:hypothetical protein [Prevotella pallens]
MNKIFFLIITLTLLFSGCMISSNTIYKISKSYVGEYKLSDTTCVVINLMLNKKNGTLHTTEIKKRNGYKSEIENLYLISIEFDTIALTGEFVDNVKYKIQQRADNVYIHPIDSIPDRILFFDKTHKVIILNISHKKTRYNPLAELINR